MCRKSKKINKESVDKKASEQDVLWAIENSVGTYSHRLFYVFDNEIKEYER
jgi:hypothetical protein